jgi:hypothetical protein
VTVHTVAEVDALPVGAILKGGSGLAVWYRHTDGWIYIPSRGSLFPWTWNTEHLPVQLIWKPETP